MGRETNSTEVNGLPATGDTVLVVAVSVPTVGLASGTAPGQIGTCEYPGAGCQPESCACSAPTGSTAQTIKAIDFIDGFPYDASARRPGGSSPCVNRWSYMRR